MVIPVRPVHTLINRSTAGSTRSLVGLHSPVVTGDVVQVLGALPSVQRTWSRSILMTHASVGRTGHVLLVELVCNKENKKRAHIGLSQVQGRHALHFSKTTISLGDTICIWV